jgi:hypothetical protein
VVVKESLESTPLRAALLLARDPAAAICAAEADASKRGSTRTAKKGGRRSRESQHRKPLPREPRRSALMLPSLGVLSDVDKQNVNSQGSGVTIRYRWYVPVLKRGAMEDDQQEHEAQSPAMVHAGNAAR